MQRISVTLTPVDRVGQKNVEPLPHISSDDTPSRNPCKVKTENAFDLKEYRNEPYGFRVVQMKGIKMLPLLAPGGPTELDDEKEPTSPDPQSMGINISSPLAPPPERTSSICASPTTEAPAPPCNVIRSIDGDDLPPLKVPTPPRRNSSQGSSEPGKKSNDSADEVPTPPRDGPSHSTAPRPAPRARTRVKRNTVAVVRFKHTDGVYHLPVHDPAEVTFQPGDYVLVDADRGEHLGRITQCNLMNRHKSGLIGSVRRHATPEEVALVHSIRLREVDVAQQCQEAATTHGVEMRVIDAEIQSDFQKLTIYYLTRTGGPVDFRQLQRYLFRVFQCRIWFVNWDEV